MPERKPNSNSLIITSDNEGIYITRYKDVYVPEEIFRKILIPYIEDQSDIYSIELEMPHKLGAHVSVIQDSITVNELRGTKALTGIAHEAKILEFVSKLQAAKKIIIHKRDKESEIEHRVKTEEPEYVISPEELFKAEVYRYKPDPAQVPSNTKYSGNLGILVIWEKDINKVDTFEVN